ncbi:hypothetical protein [Photorhabdus aegyptia]|uniref:hypothetical protein n=1 Tax=Photorhabdus aegyptia TaxID=2805098 RepID=UPI001E521B9C|nr:hypothetical protein [Photorhabdus aegyptia]MCC8459638.1 hypothetical protein [Photorhabdus aegyptia]
MTDGGGWALPMAALPNGALNSFNSWVAGKAVDYLGNEIKLSADAYVVGQYLAIGF